MGIGSVRPPPAAAAILLVPLLIPCLPAAEFEFSVVAPAAIHENETFEVAVFLATKDVAAGEEGARGWSLGVAHEGLDLVEATTAGTAVEELLRGGFESTEATISDPGKPGNDGFVSAVILSLSRNITLPTDRAALVARAIYHAGPGARSGARIAVTDGLSGSGVAVVNSVTWRSVSYRPAIGGSSWPGLTPDDRSLRVLGPSSISARPGEKRPFAVEVRLVQSFPTASAWTLALAHDPEILAIVRLSPPPALEALLDPSGFAGFEVTGGAGNAGFVARADLGPGSWKALPAGETAVAAVEYEALPRPGTGRFPTEIRFPSALEAVSGPVGSAVVPEGKLGLEPLALEVEMVAPNILLRADSNGDGTIDLTDPIAVLIHLFGGRTAPCLEASDGNDDGTIDLTDPILVLSFLFLGGAIPADPFPACGADPTEAFLGCERSSCF